MTRPTVEVPIAHVAAMAPRVWPEIFARPSDDSEPSDTELDLEEYRAGLATMQEVEAIE